MTALDQAFIRAYASQDASATVPLVVPSRPTETVEHPPEPAAVAPSAHAAPSSVLAALAEKRSQFRPIPLSTLLSVGKTTREPVPEPLTTFRGEQLPTDLPSLLSSESASFHHSDPYTTEAPADTSASSALRPAWHVEQFAWPRVCRRLITRAAEELDRLADALLAANKKGAKTIAISGWQRGEGATTLLLCAARRLAERGIKPVLVDADLDRPRLAKRLGVQPQAGWDQAASPQGMSLDQVIIEATVNNMALAPACEPAADGVPPAADRSRLADCIRTLRQHYDMVLVDLGPLENAVVRLGRSGGGAFEGIDTLVLVRDERYTSQERLDEIQGQLAAAGMAIAGLIENFVE